MNLFAGKKLARSFFVFSFILALLLISNAQAADYCSSSGRNVSYEWIELITIGTFSNPSGANGGYADFTGMVADLAIGANSIILTPGFRYGSYNEYWRIWVDFNQNQVFDSNELLFDQSSRSQITGEITVPEDAILGATRMRISMKWSGAPPACGTFYYGEVEDYTVQIIGQELALGKISDMAATNDPEYVYAIDEDQQLLYLISTSNQKIVDTISLPDPQPVAMDYSPVDDKLYIVSALSGQITVYDLNTS